MQCSLTKLLSAHKPRLQDSQSPDPATFQASGSPLTDTSYPSMDCAKIHALHDQALELASQIADLHSKGRAAEHCKDEHVLPPCLTNEREHLSAYTQQCLNCSSRSSPVRRPNICTAAPAPQGRGVYLGLVRAGDLGALSDRALNTLDDGLKAIALHFVPKAPGAPAGSFTRVKEEMIALLNRVSMRVDPMPGVAAVHFVAFRDPARGRSLRLDDARQGRHALISGEHRMTSLYFETFLQLVQFRGIDVEELP